MIYKKRWVNGIRILCIQDVKKHEKGRNTRVVPEYSSLFSFIQKVIPRLSFENLSTEKEVDDIRSLRGFLVIEFGIPAIFAVNYNKLIILYIKHF